MVKSKARHIEECATLFEIEVPKDSIDKAFSEVYGEISKVANIPGFRKGKAPMDVVKKHYAGDAHSEVLKRVIPDSYEGALKEHGVFPIGLPEITDVNFGEGKGLSFKARVETRPKFKLKNYKGIKITKKPVSIKDEDVERTLKNLQEMSAKYLPVEGRPCQMGDYAVCDLECFPEGGASPEKRKEHWLHLEKDYVIPGLTEKVAGMNAGDERDIEVTLPEKYPDKAMAGKNARFHVTVKEIKSRDLPKIDDDFAKDVGRDSLENLKKEIRQGLEQQAASNSRIDMENQLLKKLIDDNVFQVPKGLIKRQIHMMVDDAKERMEAKGFKRADLDKKDKEFEEKFKNEAEEHVRLLFILAEIAREEKMDVTGKDMDEAYKSIALQTQKSEEEVRKYYEDNDLAGNLQEKIREGKTIKFLLDKADIVEKA